MLQPRIIALTVKEPCFLVLDYETGERKLFDVKPYIQGSWYGELEDADYFRTVCLLPGGNGIQWKHGQDIAPHELYEMSEAMN